MPSLRMLIGICILYVLFLIFSIRAQAQTPLTHRPSVKITKPTKPTSSQDVDIISAKDNHDGSVTMYVLACGSMLEITAAREDVLANDPEIQAVAMKAVDKACRPPKKAGR